MTADGTPKDELSRTVAQKIGWSEENRRVPREYTPKYDSAGNIVIPDIPYHSGKNSTIFKLRKTVWREALNSTFRECIPLSTLVLLSHLY